jgi:hypothetical protein
MNNKVCKKVSTHVMIKPNKKYLYRVKNKVKPKLRKIKTKNKF